MRVSAILCTCLLLILPTALQARESQREIVLDPSAASASQACRSSPPMTAPCAWSCACPR